MHIPVMLKEVVAALQVRDGGLYVDGTLGLGGYTREMLRACAPYGVVLGCDVDPAAVEIAGRELKEFESRLRVVVGSYANIPQLLENFFNSRTCSGEGETPWALSMEGATRALVVNGICIDIGVSSLQLDTEARGFSFQTEGPLDMRMSPQYPRTAADLVNTASADKLAQWFWEYGEERFSRKIAAAIVGERTRKPFSTTTELADCVRGAVPKPSRFGRIHPATRVFQALRIVVNDELESLERFLKTAPGCLIEGGRIVVVSYHSLEDRMVKQSWKQWAATGQFQVITKRPLVPSAAEVAANPRARSAKMRVLERSKRVGSSFR